MHGAKGPIFEDAPNFDMAFKLFHGKDGVVPLSGRSYSHLDILEPKPEPQFNPLAAKAATISLSAFGPGGPFSFGSFSDKWKKNNSDSSSKKETPTQVVFLTLTNFINLVRTEMMLEGEKNVKLIYERHLRKAVLANRPHVC